MVYQILIIICLIILMINLLLNLRSIKPLEPNNRIKKSAPLVSILVPARDEENNIATCIQTLRRQDYPNLEILVLNDNSSDNTASIVSRIASKDNRIRLLQGKPLEKGWAGKPFACYQLAKEARGSWLLFVDADTIHAPNMLRYVMSQALKLKPALLSGFPCQLMDSIPQKITIPIIYFIVFSLFPLWWLKQFKNPKPSVAIGQFLLFSSEEYWNIGGHAVVKSRILEDIWLGIEISKRGGKHLAIDLSSVVSCNMYSTLHLMWQGLTRCIYSVAAISTVALIGLLIVGYFLFLAPFYWLWNVLFIDTSLVIQAIVMSQVVIILAMRWLVDSHFKASILSTPLHPIGLLFIIVICTRAIAKQVVGASVAWKSRFYGNEPTMK